MNDAEKRYDKVIRFYQSLPEPMIQEIFEQLSINRDSRRSLSKIKHTKAKIEYLLNSKSRMAWVEAAYQTIKDKVPFQLTDASYDNIVNSITDENKFYIVLFFFRWCFENNEAGESNDDLYFESFVDSELFERILSGETLDISIEESDAQGASKKEDAVLSDTVEDNASNNSTEGVNTMKLIGRIERRNTYYNFFPQYELRDGEVIELSPEELKREYPTNGGINLSYSSPYTSESSAFLDGLVTDLDSDSFVKNIYVVEVDNYDLEENNNETYQVKLDLQKLVSSGRKLHNAIVPAGNLNIYKVVTCETESIPQKTFISGNIILSETNLLEDELILLYYDRKYYGPFKALYRALDNKFYIKTDASESNYLIPYYYEHDVVLFEFEKHARYENPTFTQFAQITVSAPKQFDAITDDILIEKISEDVSLELASTNPEEFSHLCYNSPFLASLPEQIINQRYSQLMAIIKNIELFKEKKRELFDILLRHYQDNSAEALKSLVLKSDIHQELQKKYDEIRRQYEYAERLIQELQDQSVEKDSEIESLRKTTSGTATPEKVAELEDENRQLKEKIESLVAYQDVVKSIDELRKQQEGLEQQNYYLQRLAISYEDKIESARAEVSNAISESAANMASLSFDPFISSKMMESAAKWSVEEEKRSYESLNTELSHVTPSTLLGSDLVDYIVNYVQSRREYSRNEIINIYISLAQNFITIFSGEPGTGKTSMCNIIADTLGLLKYGEQINRFVSVSVERGWSSKRDLIGYFNPLTRKYDKSNGKIYDALRLLDAERESSSYPFLIMLDEANLSPIEYYWADFMRLTDRSSSNDAVINIGADQEIYIPETLRFVATINTDQTTETLSPRLIDRACIIKLPKVEPKHNTAETSSASEIITWKSFYDTFSNETPLNPITQKALKEIYKLFIDYGMNVSPRIQLGIEKYVKAAQSIMENETGVLAREKALDYAIVQKLLPKINGYYTTYEIFFDNLKQLCREYNLNMTEEAISQIVDSQERNMGYCQYLI